MSLLGTAQSFAVLGATTVTNTGPSIIFGDLGVSPGSAITGFPPGIVTGGTIHANDGVATQAHADLATAYGVLVGSTSTQVLAGNLGGLTLLPGVYRINTAAQLTGTLTLDAQSDPNASFDFLIGTTLITASDSSVNLINGAHGDNVFFQVGSSATLGANTAFAGNILANTSITLTTGASIANGRALAVNAAVTMDTNSIAIAPALLVIDDVTVNENEGTATFTVSLSRPSGEAISVVADTANGSAVAPGDYTATSSILTFAPGVTSQTFTVPVVNDALNEATETLTVNLTGAIGANIADSVGVASILDDDPTPTLSIDSVTIDENAGTAVFTVTLSAASGQSVSVGFATAPQAATAPADYQAVAGTLTFLPGGALTQTIIVPIVDDAIFETSESFLLNLSAPTNATLSNTVGTGTIVDDEPEPTITITGLAMTEGDAGTSSVAFVVTLSGLSSLPITVQFATADGTATAGVDYVASGGTLTIPAGSLTGTILVPITGDLLDETDEAFVVNLTAPTNATLALGQAQGAILDDDATPTATISGATVTEGDAGTTNAVFTVTLSAVSGRDVTLNFATADGTATAGVDYVASGGTLTIPAGSLTGTILVPITGDLLDEFDEAFVVNLSNPTNATVAGAQGLGAILDDDTSPVAVADGFTGARGTTLTVSGPGVLSNDSDGDGNLLTAVLVSGPSSGVLVLNADGSFTYTPNAGFSGLDRFTYRAIGGGNSSTVATATITIRDMVGPAVPDLTRFGFHASPTFLVLTFGEDLNPARAGDVSNYRLLGPNGRPIALTSAVYDGATRTVTLRPSRMLPLNSGYRLVVNGSTPSGVADQFDNLLDGDRDGLAGGDSTLEFGREALRALATNRTQRALARRFQIPVVSDSGLSRQLIGTMNSPRFLRLLARTWR
ncbi:Calx-beta domain-containing protein [Isosphaeraceae bacterium EP7]